MLVAVAVTAATAKAQSAMPVTPVSGVVESVSGAPLSGAQVQWVNGASTAPAVTDVDGRFRLDAAPAADARLAVRRIGFRAETLAVVLPLPPSGVILTLEPLAVALSQVTVRAVREEYVSPIPEFNARRARGFGIFLTRQDIDQRRAHRTTDLFRAIPNMEIERDGGRSRIRMRGRACDPLVWIDRVPLVGGFPDLEAMAPNSIEALEVYPGVSTVPPELIGPREAGGCGVIVVWTRHGEPPPRPAAGTRGGEQRVVRVGGAPDLVAQIDAARLFTADQVDSMAAPLAASVIQPAYPDSLRAERVAGAALAEFVVDTAGEIELETVSIVAATHPAFGDAVRTALVGVRFSPAVRAGRSVRQLVMLPVRFVPEEATGTVSPR